MESHGAWMRFIAILLTSALFTSLARADDALNFLVSPDFPNQPSVVAEAISPALLAAYYEHGREHTPPRRPGGTMQRREYFYRAPAEPFELLTTLKLGDSPADKNLAVDLARLRDAWERGLPVGVELRNSLGLHASGCSLPPETLLEGARGLQWLVSEDTAATFFAAGLSKARAETAGARLSPARASLLLHMLDQTACLWRNSKQSALVCRFTIARSLATPLSVESRRAGFLLAEALLDEDRRDEAADLILSVDNEHKRAGDLGRYDAADVPEMNFVTGFILFNANRISAAIPYFSAVTGEHRDDAGSLLLEAYIRTSRFAEAQQLIMPKVTSNPQPLQPTRISTELRDEMNRARWRAEIGPDLAPPH